MTNVARLTSVEARMVADYASGVRSEGPEFMVVDKEGGIKVEKDYTPPCSTEEVVVVPVDTPVIQPGRPPVEEVWIRAEGMSVMWPLSQFDAVFWSEAAVEKFLFPYLASKYQWLAADVIQTLSTKWYGCVPTPETGPCPPPNPVEEIPFAVGHLPRSDYVTIGEEVVCFFRDAQGKVTARPLSEFL